MNREYGVYVAVDDQFSAMIPKREVYGRMQNGQQIEARVTAVKADGKLDLSVRGKIPQQMDKDARLLLERMKERGGNLPFTDKASPEQIRQEFDMSKAAFKRAVGRLLKENKIEIGETQIRLLSTPDQTENQTGELRSDRKKISCNSHEMGYNKYRNA